MSTPSNVTIHTFPTARCPFCYTEVNSGSVSLVSMSYRAVAEIYTKIADGEALAPTDTTPMYHATCSNCGVRGPATAKPEEAVQEFDRLCIDRRKEYQAHITVDQTYGRRRHNEPLVSDIVRAAYAVSEECFGKPCGVEVRPGIGGGDVYEVIFRTPKAIGWQVERFLSETTRRAWTFARKNSTRGDH